MTLGLGAWYYSVVQLKVVRCPFSDEMERLAGCILSNAYILVSGWDARADTYDVLTKLGT